MPNGRRKRGNLPRTPLHLRQLKAEMVLRDLTLTQVADAADIPISTASKILRGLFNDPHRLGILRKVILGIKVGRAVTV